MPTRPSDLRHIPAVHYANAASGLSLAFNSPDGKEETVNLTPAIYANSIGMLVESMAGKAGALHGIFQDSTPFQFHEGQHQRAIDYFGEQLQKAGFNYYGNEPLYSGVSGVEMRANIFIGVVYYQRLRHMVSDKFQVRSTGPMDQVTRQPIKGRKRGGGIRFGEMERDSLLAHGAAFLLQDRLLNCSDKHTAWVCASCGSLLSPTATRHTRYTSDIKDSDIKCRNPDCEGSRCLLVQLPYVFRYLANELLAMNMRLFLDVK